MSRLWRGADCVDNSGPRFHDDTRSIRPPPHVPAQEDPHRPDPAAHRPGAAGTVRAVAVAAQKSALAVRRFAAGDDLPARSDCPGHAGGRQCPDAGIGAAGADQRRGTAPRPGHRHPRRRQLLRRAGIRRRYRRQRLAGARALRRQAGARDQAAGAGHQWLAARRPGRGGLDARGAGTRIRRQGAVGPKPPRATLPRTPRCRRRCSRPMALPASRW